MCGVDGKRQASFAVFWQISCLRDPLKPLYVENTVIKFHENKSYNLQAISYRKKNLN